MNAKKRKEAEIIIGTSIVTILLVFLLLGASDANGVTASAWLVYYGHALAGSLAEFVYVVILALCLCVILLVIWSFGGSFLSITFPTVFRKLYGDKKMADNPRKVFLETAYRSRDALLLIPVILFIALAGIAMGEANQFARARLVDTMVIGWEHSLFGTYVFAALGSVTYPHWLIEFIIFSFDNMSLILVVAGVVIAHLYVKRFRELLVAFCIGILIMIPLWLLVPVLSPQDRFIDNYYQLPMPPAIALAVANYHPQPEIVAFLQYVRAQKADLPALPTSTIPSAHIFWAVLAGYYLFRTRRWLGWVMLPILIASSFGTVLFAQHYFMDVPAGITVAIISIWLAHDIEEPPRARAT